MGRSGAGGRIGCAGLGYTCPHSLSPTYVSSFIRQTLSVRSFTIFAGFPETNKGIARAQLGYLQLPVYEAHEESIDEAYNVRRQILQTALIY